MCQAMYTVKTGSNPVLTTKLNNMENQTEQTTWVLSSIRIDRISYGTDAGKYKGSIHFTNGDFDEFTFKLNPTLANAYLELIKDTVVLSANQLVEKLKQSLENK